MFLVFKTHIRPAARWIGLLSFFGSFLCIPAISQDYNFRKLLSPDGLSQSFVYSITQDEQGYLWVGTGAGLSRYNGFVFEDFTTEDSLADYFITSSISDGKGMWFGHMNGQLTYYNGKVFQTVHSAISDLSPVTHFARGPDGRIWAGTNTGGLLKLSKETGVVTKYRLRNQESVISFDFLEEGDLLIGTNTGLLHCRLKEPGEIDIVRIVKEIPESKVTGIVKMKFQKGFYITTENDGVYKLTYGKGQFNISELNSVAGFDLSGIQSIYEDSRSDLWLASFGNGLIRMDYSASGTLIKTERFNKTNGFPTDNVKTVFGDRNGNIWAGNFGEGLTQVMSKIYTVDTFDNFRYGNAIFSIYSGQCFRWIGTQNGLLKLDRKTGRIIRFFGEGSGLPKDMVTALYAAGEKELWIGTEEHGVFRMDTDLDKITKYPTGNGALEKSVTAITGEKEQVWIGTKKGLCNIQTGTDHIKWYSISQGGLPHNFINSLYLDRSGRLWISSHSNTLAYIRDGKIFKLPISSENGAVICGPITEDANSRIWMGSNGNGVFIVDTDSVVNLSTNEGLLSGFCYSIMSDDSNHIWVGHKGGLSKIRVSDFFVKPIHHFENITGNCQFNSNAIHKDLDGRIWFGSDEGLLSYDPLKDYPQSLPPVPVIASIKINDAAVDHSNKIVLGPGRYKIQIDYLAVNLREPELVTYQFKLEGHNNWSDITNNTSITYDFLPEGEYIFILKACTGDGVVSENPVTISITIKRPVWKHWGFYAINFLLLIILVFLYVKRREYRFLNEKKILEEKVKQRTNEIQCQKDEIELQRDLIESKNMEITSSIRYARNIQRAVLPSMDHVDTLLPDNFIFIKPKDIVSGDFYWISEKNNKIIFTIGDCTGHGVPGAFMSLLSITLLNEIVNVHGVTSSDDIVSQLRERIFHSLHQYKKDLTTLDGLDLALCVLDKDKGTIQFTGAMNNLVYIREGNLEIIKADHFSVNGMFVDFGPITKKEFNFRKGDIIYLFSDGYKDQFGGDQDKKYSVKRFYETLLEIHKLPMKEQRIMLKKKLSHWMQETVQTDDVTVMGVRL